MTHSESMRIPPAAITLGADECTIDRETRTSRLTFLEGELSDQSGTLLAKATSTVRIIPPD